MSQSRFSQFPYYIGGSLPPDAPTYIRRQADHDLYESLKQGEFCHILNARQMGKSSLCVQVMQRLQRDGYVCAAIDLTSIGATRLTDEQWYAGIINNLVNAFNLNHAFDLSTWWSQQGLLPPVQRLSVFLESVLLQAITAPIIIFVDEIDNILSLQLNLDDFFALIRNCYNRRADQPIYRRLTFTLVGVSTPSTLIQDHHITPFNTSRAIDLTSFQLQDTAPLAMGLAVVGDPKALMQAVLDWTGGQPFLTQKVCKLLVQELERSESKIPHSESEIPDWVEGVVCQRVIENWEAQDEPQHLRTIRDRILFNIGNQQVWLLRLCQQILQQEYIIANDSLEQTTLRLTGLVVRQEGKLQIYNRIYQAIFTQDWIEQELANFCSHGEVLPDWIALKQQSEFRLL